MANMDLELGVTLLFMVADESTPDSLRGYNGWAIGLTAAQVAALPPGVDNTLTVKGVVLPGYKRVREGTLEWVMSPPVDPVVTMFNALPGPGGWADPAAQAKWASVGLALLDMGVDRAAFITEYPNLYNAAIANYLAQGN